MRYRLLSRLLKVVGITLYRCADCGCVVKRTDIHDEFHAQLAWFDES